MVNGPERSGRSLCAVPAAGGPLTMEHLITLGRDHIRPRSVRAGLLPASCLGDGGLGIGLGCVYSQLGCSIRHWGRRSTKEAGRSERVHATDQVERTA